MLAYRFPYSAKWKGNAIADGEGKPYEFYLTEGEHTLSMKSTYAPNKPVLIELERAVDVLRGVDEDLKSLTGGVEDTRRTWKIERDMPDLPERLQRVSDMLQQSAERLLESNGRQDLIIQGIQSAAKDIGALLRNADEIPNRTDRVASLRGKISDLFELMVRQPLQVDKIYIAPAGQPFPRMEASLFSKWKGMAANFIYSFRQKDRLTEMDDKVLNVWVNRGRNHVNMLQELADDSFTPEHGIKVKVSLLPTTQVLVPQERP